MTAVLPAHITELDELVEQLATIAILGDLALLVMAEQALDEQIKAYGVDGNGDESLDDYNPEFEAWLNKLEAKQAA